MRYQGRITDWKDDKGFGFVTPNGGGPRVFVHIKSFSNRQRRPVGNELVTYELGSDERGRPRGMNIAFVGDRPSAPPPDAPPGPGLLGLGFAGTFLLFVAGTVTLGKLPFTVLLAYLAASCVTYLAYAFDKAAAMKGQRRTPESTLHVMSLAGGWPGAMLAQKSFRHKTQKQTFQTTYWGTVILNCAILGLLLTQSGMRFLRSFFGMA